MSETSENYPKFLLKAINYFRDESPKKSTQPKVQLRKEDPEVFYSLVKSITKGTFGEVMLVQSNQTGELFAMKKIYYTNHREKSRVVSEVALMMHCKHECIINYYECFSYLKSIWILEEPMEFSLAEFLKQHSGTLSEEVIAYILKELLRALEFLAQKQVIHRDVSSGNVMIGSQGEVKLGDFGYAAQLSSERLKRTTVVGTPRWMAPEIVTGCQYNGKVDIWSLGIVAYELAEGSSTSEENPVKILYNVATKPAPELDQTKNWSEEFVNFIEKCLEKSQDQRPFAKELLRHPFLLKASTGKNVFKDLIDVEY